MPPARKEKIGMKEIAEAAGVSVMTVSAALSGSGRVSEKRKREIVALAHRMGYRTNAAARLLKSKRVDDLGLLIFEKEELIREHAGFMDMTVQFMKECVRDNGAANSLRRPNILRCPAKPNGGWTNETNFADYLYTRDSSNVYCQADSFNKSFARLKNEVITYCISGDMLLRNGVEVSKPMPEHNNGISVSRADGSCGWVSLNSYRKGTTLDARLKLIDDMN